MIPIKGRIETFEEVNKQAFDRNVVPSLQIKSSYDALSFIKSTLEGNKNLQKEVGSKKFAGTPSFF